MKRTIVAVVVSTMLFGAMATGAQAAKHGDPPCTVTPNPATVGQTYTVSVSGLPTSTTLNLWTIDPSGGKSGMPLGTVYSGAINYSTSAPYAGTWSYQITGTNSTKIYSSCSVQVN